MGSGVSVPPGTRVMVVWVLFNTRPPLFPAGFWMNSAFLCVCSSKHTPKLLSKLRCFYCARIPQASSVPSSTMLFTLLDLMEVGTATFLLLSYWVLKWNSVPTVNIQIYIYIINQGSCTNVKVWVLCQNHTRLKVSTFIHALLKNRYFKLSTRSSCVILQD